MLLNRVLGRSSRQAVVLGGERENKDLKCCWIELLQVKILG